MDAEAAELSQAAVAGAIADPSRSIMLCALLDGRARTATELAAPDCPGRNRAGQNIRRLTGGRRLGLNPPGHR